MTTATRKTKPKADRVQNIVHIGNGLFDVHYTTPGGLSTLRKGTVKGKIIYQDGDIKVHGVESTTAAHVNGKCHVPYTACALETPNGTFAFHFYPDHISTQYWGNDCTPSEKDGVWFARILGATALSDTYIRFGTRSQMALRAVGVVAGPPHIAESVSQKFEVHQTGDWHACPSEFIDLP